MIQPYKRMPCRLRDPRTWQQIREHYDIERELADRLRSATREERRHLYSELYDELFRRVPHHPLLLEKPNSTARTKSVADSVRFLDRFVTADSTFLEIGPGDCLLSFAMVKKVRKVYAVDVSEEITHQDEHPRNFELIISDGVSIDISPETIDVAYSKDLMEHLHPDDALDQLSNIFRVLAPGGVYICRTPNPLSGPHDVSKYFDDELATAFHLREYTTTELARLCRAVGFSHVQPYIWGKGRLVRLPLGPVVLGEAALSRLPRRTNKWLATRFLIKRILNRVIATK